MEHAKLSPSSSARWLTCPGSGTQIDALQKLLGTSDSASDPALKGTAMHNIAERMLLDKGITPDFMFWTDTKGDNQVITKDDINECVRPYIEFADTIEGDRYVELKVQITDEVWGTSDLTIFGEGILTVCDLKTGHGKVDAKDNTQLKLYALGALNSDIAMMYGDIDVINVVISQGRINHHDSYAYSLEEMLEFEEEVQSRAKSLAKRRAKVLWRGL